LAFEENIAAANTITKKTGITYWEVRKLFITRILLIVLATAVLVVVVAIISASIKCSNACAQVHNNSIFNQIIGGFRLLVESEKKGSAPHQMAL
jgi:cell division protein FtsL